MLALSSVRVRYLQPLRGRGPRAAARSRSTPRSSGSSARRAAAASSDSGTTRPGPIVLEADEVDRRHRLLARRSSTSRPRRAHGRAGPHPRADAVLGERPGSGIYFAGNATQGAPGLRKHGVGGARRPCTASATTPGCSPHLAGDPLRPRGRRASASDGDAASLLAAELTHRPELWTQKAYLARVVRARRGDRHRPARALPRRGRAGRGRRRRRDERRGRDLSCRLPPRGGEDRRARLPPHRLHAFRGPEHERGARASCCDRRLPASLGVALAVPLAGLVLLLAAARPGRAPGRTIPPTSGSCSPPPRSLPCSPRSSAEAAGRRGDARVFLVSLAFLCASGFLGLHALATPGRARWPGRTPASRSPRRSACSSRAASPPPPRSTFSPRQRRPSSRRRRAAHSVRRGRRSSSGRSSPSALPPLDEPITPETRPRPLLGLSRSSASLLYGFAAAATCISAARAGAPARWPSSPPSSLLAEAMLAIAFSRNWHATLVGVAPAHAPRVRARRAAASGSNGSAKARAPRSSPTSTRSGRSATTSR